MAKPPLSMKPTGWFQVAWSDEIKVGDVHRMKYFGQELIAWRAESGQLTVMNAYCEHLGAHLGFGGHVEGEVLQCPFHGWQWNSEGHNVCIPYDKRPNRGRRIKTYPAVERNESVYLWYDDDGREPFFDAPDVFASFGDTSTVADYYPQRRLFEQGHEMHPQYVLENGVDFAHFKYVHHTPINPIFTRHDFDEPVSYVDFTITFEGDDQQVIDDVKSGVEAINGGLGIAVTKSWGMIDNRTISCITPVDESHLRCAVHGLHRPHTGQRHRACGHQSGRIRRRGHPPVPPGHPHLVASALLRSPRADRRGILRFHRNPRVGQAVLSRWHRWQRRRRLCRT